MTLFQLIVEMPLTRRAESDAPLKLVERLAPVPRTQGSRRRELNYVVHIAIGAGWGAGQALLRRATGTEGQASVAVSFATLYGGDVLLNTALGLYEPLAWSRKDWAVDIGNKLVLAEASEVALRWLDAR